jgi:hypothetical protein
VITREDEIREIVREIVRKVLSESLQQTPVYYSPWTGVEYQAHPSRQQFNIDEAINSAGQLHEFAETSQCSIEKNKPCFSFVPCLFLDLDSAFAKELF